MRNEQNSHPTVYAIVVTYNGSKWIEKCLSSLKNSVMPLHTIVIDNASADDTVSTIEKKFPEVELIKSEKNLGFGAANNIGLRRALEADADYVLLLNQDAWIEKDALEKLVVVSKKNLDFAILSPFHLNYQGNATERYFDEWILRHYTKHLVSAMGSGNLQEVYPTSFVHAACWLMPIETVRRVGGFDPLFFHYGEDNDFVQRVHYDGLKVGIVAKAYIHHQGSNEGLKSPGHNIPFLINQSLLLFKDPKASTPGATLLFFKQLIANHIKGLNKPLSRASRFNLRRLGKMMVSRQQQYSPQAYLKE